MKKRFEGKVREEDVLNETIEVLKDLNSIKTKVAPCYPEKYDIYNVYKEKIFALLKGYILKYLDEKIIEKESGYLIPIANWYSKFVELCKDLGDDPNKTEIQTEVQKAMTYYYSDIGDTLSQMMQNIRKQNQEEKKTICEMVQQKKSY